LFAFPTGAASAQGRQLSANTRNAIRKLNNLISAKITEIKFIRVDWAIFIISAGLHF